MYDQTPEIEFATALVFWNKGELIGQKPPLTLKQIWAIRIRVQMDRRLRDLALFNLASDGAAAQDRAAGAFRVDRADPRCGAGLDRRAGAVRRGFSLSQPDPRVSPPLHTAIRADHARLGLADRAGSRRVRHPLAAAHQGNADLPAHEE